MATRAEIEEARRRYNELHPDYTLATRRPGGAPLGEAMEAKRVAAARKAGRARAAYLRAQAMQQQRPPR